jgi:uncharacterized membrane protein YidH (DUF202 family)
MAVLGQASPYSDPGPPPEPAAPDDDMRFELERMLMDADRMMMQAVSLSLSLIGFGFSINTFFRAAANEGAVANGDLTARRLGLALLVIGLLFLSMSIWGQARYRRELSRRYGRAERASAWRAAFDGRVTPTFITALLLLLVGLSALVSIMLRRVF